MGHGNQGLLILLLGGGGLEIMIKKRKNSKKEMSLRFFLVGDYLLDVSCGALTRRQSVAVNCNITNSERRYGQFVKTLWQLDTYGHIYFEIPVTSMEIKYTKRESRWHLCFSLWESKWWIPFSLRCNELIFGGTYPTKNGS